MSIAIVLIVIAALLAAGGVAALVLGTRGRTPSPSFVPQVSQVLANAHQQAAAVVAEARTSALHSHEAAMEEVAERLASVESREALIAERHKHLRERREVFDERRFAYRKRRDEIEERRAKVAEQGEEIAATLRAKAALDRDAAALLVLDRVASELVAERGALVEATVADIIGERVETSANDLILQAVERQDASNVDTAPRISPFSLEGLDDHAQERILSALAVIAEQTGAELGVDTEKQQATLRTVDPIGREIARQAALEVVDRRIQASEVPPLIQKTRRSTQRKVMEAGERALWLMQIEGRPELAELVGTLHHRFSYGQNALLHCQETGHLCGVLAAELGLPQSTAREAGMLHDIGKAVDHDVEGVHAIIGGELLRVLGVDAGIVHAVKAHHFDEEPSTDLAMLTICADAISASRPGARRDTLATYLLRLEQLQTIATRHGGVDRAFPLQAGRELRVFVKASQVKDTDMPPLTAEIAREIESEMQYPGVIKVTVIRETTAMATAPAQLVPVRAAVAEHAGHHEPELDDDVDDVDTGSDDA
ncbi:MAG TPA: HDIG domain-containing protein [Candidatus Saccharimonadales bacterium]|nr:HDIG domain-containing protein [Candidatus Saccharimonadales bacterium]